MTAHGDLVAANTTASVEAFSLGANNEVLTVDTSEPLGIKWAAPSVTTGKAIAMAIVFG